MGELDPKCTVCGHPRSEHSEEQPYECMNGDICDCDGFSYVPQVKHGISDESEDGQI